MSPWRAYRLSSSLYYTMRFREAAASILELRYPTRKQCEHAEANLKIHLASNSKDFRVVKLENGEEELQGNLLELLDWSDEALRSASSSLSPLGFDSANFMITRSDVLLHCASQRVLDLND